MDKSMVVSYSELIKLDSCPRQYYYNFIKGIIPVEQSDAITTGVKGHTLLQTFYRFLQTGKSKEEALSLTQTSAKELMAVDKVDFNLLRAWTLVDNYIRATDFTHEAVLVEERFLFPASQLTDDPFFNDIQIGFTPDVVIKRSGGFHDIEDAKFVQRAWSKKKLDRYVQTKLYQIFLTEMGYNVSRTVARFFNVTTGEVKEQSYKLTEETSKILIHDFLEGVRGVVLFRRQDAETLANSRRTMNNTTCQFCSYEEPCNLEAQGKDATNTFKYFFKKSEYDYTK